MFHGNWTLLDWEFNIGHGYEFSILMYIIAACSIVTAISSIVIAHRSKRK